jgi:L-fucose isomerase-like protein
MSRKPVLAVMALARATFDVDYAERTAARAFETLGALDARLVGPRRLLFDADAAARALEEFERRVLDLLLVLQVTFTDAGTTRHIAERIEAPLAFWAFPEPRSGGRLRLNSLCGVNLAAHALSRTGRSYGWLHCAPDAPEAAERIGLLLSGRRRQASGPAPGSAAAPEAPAATAETVLARIAGGRIGLVGERPEGFDTCDFDEGEIGSLLGLRVERLPLRLIFEAAQAQTKLAVERVRERVERDLAGTEQVDQEPLERSLRVFGALSDVAREHELSALAVRCWPEFFTEYGCAACGPMAMSSQDGVPCACEADLYGAATSLLLQAIAGAPPFMADLVDVDPETDTSVLWHCGLAPLSLADPAERPRAGIHSNRRLPLLGEFALKAGRVTLARLSRSRGQTRLAIGGGRMLAAPRSFSGTSGVVRFDAGAGEVLDRILDEGLEHHVSLAYGDLRPELRAVARRLSLPVLELC